MKSKNDNTMGGIEIIVNLDRIIHEPARLALMSLLYVVESADFLFLEKQTGLSRGNLSSHLSKLETANYIRIKKEFVDKIPRTLIRLNQTGHKAFKKYVSNISTFLKELPK